MVEIAKNLADDKPSVAAPKFARVPIDLIRGGYGLSHGARLALVALIGIHAIRTRPVDEERPQFAEATGYEVLTLQDALAENDFRFRPAEVRSLLGCGGHVYDWISELVGAGVLVENDLGYETRWTVALPDGEHFGLQLGLQPVPVDFNALHGLSPTEAAVWLAVKSAEGLRQPPTLKQIAAWAGVSVKGTHAIIRRLEAKGRIQVQRTRTRRGFQGRNSYVLPSHKRFPEKSGIPQGESGNSPRVNLDFPQGESGIPQGESGNSPRVNTFGRDKTRSRSRGEIQGRVSGFSPAAPDRCKPAGLAEPELLMPIRGGMASAQSAVTEDAEAPTAWQDEASAPLPEKIVGAAA